MWSSLSLVMMSANISYYAVTFPLMTRGSGEKSPPRPVLRCPQELSNFMYSHIDEGFTLKRL